MPVFLAGIANSDFSSFYGLCKILDDISGLVGVRYELGGERATAINRNLTVYATGVNSSTVTHYVCVNPGEGIPPSRVQIFGENIFYPWPVAALSLRLSGAAPNYPVLITSSSPREFSFT